MTEDHRELGSSVASTLCSKKQWVTQPHDRRSPRTRQ
eukprot:CAMPEP_0179197442 /NCGR_PEP_ID=MMETSP0796-20121207/98186_1 /TAXON_ID=73915 /ORGANISM="Pyrodinium bahamense, Strain pbaha01" /LENGTH=36 /DNA_ID= /DNA_START= /DNA_END= /DNA_ORIENTATION=